MPGRMSGLRERRSVSRRARAGRSARSAIVLAGLGAARLAGCGDVTPYVVERPQFDTGVLDAAPVDSASLASDADADAASDADDASGASGAEGASTDGDARDPQANCVKPGDPGNELGLGRYCEQAADCAFDGALRLCTAQFTTNPYAWFCTTLCADTSQCGTGALCVLTPAGMRVCVPPACLPADAGLDGG